MTAPAADVHALIERECRILQSNDWPAGDNFSAYPHALALIEAAIAAMEASIPDKFEHQGRTYRLRTMLKRIDLGILVDPASAKPLLRLQTEGLRWCGFKPGH